MKVKYQLISDAGFHPHGSGICVSSYAYLYIKNNREIYSDANAQQLSMVTTSTIAELYGIVQGLEYVVADNQLNMNDELEIICDFKGIDNIFYNKTVLSSNELVHQFKQLIMILQKRGIQVQFKWLKRTNSIIKKLDAIASSHLQKLDKKIQSELNSSVKYNGRVSIFNQELVHELHGLTLKIVLSQKTEFIVVEQIRILGKIENQNHISLKKLFSQIFKYLLEHTNAQLIGRKSINCICNEIVNALKNKQFNLTKEEYMFFTTTSNTTVLQHYKLLENQKLTLTQNIK